MSTQVSRRAVLQGGIALAAASAVTWSRAQPAVAATAEPTAPAGRRRVKVGVL